MATEPGNEAQAEIADAPADAGGDPSDLAIVAEIEASGEAGEPSQDKPTDAPAAPEKGDKPAEEKPAEEKPAEPATDSPEMRRARSILATANRRLALANKRAAETQANIVKGLREKPLETLRSLGVPLPDVLEAGQNEGEPKVETADERVARLEKLIKDRDAEAAAAREQARVDQFVEAKKKEAVDEVRASKDFPLTNGAPDGTGHALVLETMVEYFKLHGKRCTVAAAAASVEDYLAKLAGKTSAPAAPSNGQPDPKRPGSTTTLTNRDTRNVGSGPDDLPLDPDQRFEAVMREMGLRSN